MKHRTAAHLLRTHRWASPSAASESGWRRSSASTTHTCHVAPASGCSTCAASPTCPRQALLLGVRGEILIDGPVSSLPACPPACMHAPTLEISHPPARKPACLPACLPAAPPGGAWTVCAAGALPALVRPCHGRHRVPGLRCSHCCRRSGHSAACSARPLGRQLDAAQPGHPGLCPLSRHARASAGVQGGQRAEEKPLESAPDILSCRRCCIVTAFHTHTVPLLCSPQSLLLFLSLFDHCPAFHLPVTVLNQAGGYTQQDRTEKHQHIAIPA